ncbi:MAG: TIGR00730 family Rossman fold protein [Proteobacteria bacterium]|nr:TIGR00730 family Rossman fold protein [Burkholderiales bacterium]
MKAVCVFCGSNAGALPEYRAAAEMLARQIVEAGCTLVYGGGRVGLMGVIGDAAMAAGGRVIGVTPRRLVEKEVAHAGLTELRVVESMHERKAMMAELSDAFIALPGGIGTFEEFFEVLTWSQLGFHAKPCGLLNVAGYYDQLLAFLDHSTAQGFIRREHRGMVLTDTEPARLLDQLETFRMPVVNKWLDLAST